jgi:hypothetical protein
MNGVMYILSTGCRATIRAAGEHFKRAALVGG